MGWTWYIATHYKNGKIDRKAELDHLFEQEECDKTFGDKTHHFPKMTVLKSRLIGTTYYGAIESVNSKENTRKVFAVVCLTSVDAYEFGYKDMDETCGPYQCECPESILKLLTETDSEYALEWRKKCKEHNELHKKTTNAINLLKRLPLGSKIKFKALTDMSSGINKGDEVVLTKIRMSDNKWYDGIYSWKISYINSNFEVVNC